MGEEILRVHVPEGQNELQGKRKERRHGSIFPDGPPPPPHGLSYPL